MTTYQAAATTSGEPIALFGVEPQEDGIVLALGSHAATALKAGRLVWWGGRAYKLATPMPAGLKLVGGPPGHELERPIVLHPRKGRSPA